MRQVESKPGLGIAGIPGIIPQPMGVPGPYNYAGVGGPVLTANLPNKILFLQQIPSQVNKQELEHTFRSMYGFVEVRTVPGKSSIAFVEFEDEGSAIEAKNVLGNEWNLKEGQPPVLITFAKR
ncbi:U2 small nuclear ribonucleoprotein B'' [Zancudomyces culisetae]|nr:U2 small nuclear ribonucleoprotein B'' [Zancudomyces culisetae]OMH84034.1 U2 small nuclear ribonucleoprotein B'' [Zancudomyces culisetae]|eukprot:OMH78927.1 U2 small nuclear ribonucleoprotein B'' [Zancudomyces culisetae]